jgi:hypothetical protein
MNTPDQGPKDGDFVAYLAELERRQLPPSQPTGPTGAHPLTAKPTPILPIAKPVAMAVANAGAIAKSFPVGLVVIALVLVIAGALFDGGIFLIVIGVFLLWQAARVMIRNARAAAPNRSQAAQQVANLLAAHIQHKK